MNKVAETFGRLSKFVAESGDEQDTLYLIEGQEETIAVDNLELRTRSLSPLFCHVTTVRTFVEDNPDKKKKKLENSSRNEISENFLSKRNEEQFDFHAWQAHKIFMHSWEIGSCKDPRTWYVGVYFIHKNI